MFTIGLEFSVSKTQTISQTVSWTGHFSGDWHNLSYHGDLLFPGKCVLAKIFILWLLLSLSSTAIVVKLLQDARESEAPYGIASIGVLLCQDLAVIPMMLSIPLLGSTAPTSLGLTAAGSISDWVVRFLVVAAGLYLGGKYVVPFMLERVAKTKSRELFFSAILMLCFSTAFALQK